MNADERGLFIRIVLGDVTFLQNFEIAFFQIEVRSGDHFSTAVCSDPIDNLWRIGAEKDAVRWIQWLPIFAREDPNVRVLPVANVLKISLEALERRRCRSGRGRCGSVDVRTRILRCAA